MQITDHILFQLSSSILSPNMFRPLLFLSLIAYTLADNFQYTADLKASSSALSCGQNEIAVGVSCTNGCNSIGLKCIRVDAWGPPGTIHVYDKASCDASMGAQLLSGFDQGLNPKCRELWYYGKLKRYERHCKDYKVDFDNGVGVNCADNQVISKLSVDRDAKKINVACCQDNDHF